MKQFRSVHVGVAALLAAAAVTGVGLIREVGAAGPGTASTFVPIVPCRLADTRTGGVHVGPRTTPIGAGEAVTFAVWGANGACTIPNTATGIATNVTAVNPNAASYLTVYPSDASPRPTASNLNYTAGSPPTPNQVTVALSATGAVNAFNNAGTVDLIIDIVGYYQPAGAPAAQNGQVVFTGQSVVSNSPDDSYDVSNACYTAGTTFVPAAVALTVPSGATITGVAVRYIDGSASPGSYTQYGVWATNPGVSEELKGSFTSVTGGPTTAGLNLTGPPVSPTNAYYLNIFATANTQKFCSATVVYTL